MNQYAQLPLQCSDTDKRQQLFLTLGAWQKAFAFHAKNKIVLLFTYGTQQILQI